MNQKAINLQTLGLSLDELHYSSDKYQHAFEHIEDSIFRLRSEGTLEDKSFKQQLETGNLIRQRLRETAPNKKYHLIWDTSKVKGVSFIARNMLVRALKNQDNMGYIFLVGASRMVQSMSGVLRLVIPDLKLVIVKSEKEALELLHIKLSEQKENEQEHGMLVSTTDTDSFGVFIEMWQEKGEEMVIGNNSFKVVHNDDWVYQSAKSSYRAEFSVIDGNIVWLTVTGSANNEDIAETYNCQMRIIDVFNYSSPDNKFYSVIDLRGLRDMKLGVRRTTTELEARYRHLGHMVIMIPSALTHFALKVHKRINPRVYSHWTIAHSPNEAIKIITEHRLGSIDQSIFDIEKVRPDSFEVPTTREKLMEFAHKQHTELMQFKAKQKEELDRLIEITGRMTWDESFDSQIPFQNNPDNPFNDLYKALLVLQSDFQEILSERSRQSDQLKESEEKYFNLVNLAKDIILVDKEGILCFVNPAIQDILGYTSEEITGKGIDILFTENCQKLLDTIPHGSGSESKKSLIECTFKHKLCYDVPVSLNIAPVVYENKPARMIIARDITLRKRAETELHKYRNHLEELVKERSIQLEKEITERKEAEHSDRLKSAFISNMSHEIRTPMNAIIAFSNFLRDESLSKERKTEYIDYIQSSGQSLSNLIDDIIDIAKIEAQKLRVNKVNCDVHHIMSELNEYFAASISRKGLTQLRLFYQQPKDSKKLILLTDPYRFKQVMSNLIDNAIKFTEKGFIEFGYELNPDHVRFYVADTGIGIPEDKIDRIFERFGKLETPEYINSRGTGLGLAISRHLVQLLGGELNVQSTPGRGTRFVFSLPNQINIKNSMPITNTIETKQPDSFDWSGKTILVAEDEDLNYKVLQIGLSRTNANIIRAKDGSEALDICKRQAVDLVLMDVQMPYMDGYEATFKIKYLKKELPIIAQTAFAMIGEKERCIEAGFNDYVSKPIDLNELLPIMKRYLG